MTMASIYDQFVQKISAVIVGIFLLLSNSKAQDNLDLNPRIGKVDSTGIFHQDGYYVWCTSVIKGEDGKYHMFYSRWQHGKRVPDDDSMNYIFNGFRWLE
jgi:hypothetical protein